MPSEKILNQKKAKVEELSEKFKKAKMIVLTEYRGISVADDTKLRAQVRADGNEYVLLKIQQFHMLQKQLELKD